MCHQFFHELICQGAHSPKSISTASILIDQVLGEVTDFELWFAISGEFWTSSLTVEMGQESF